MDQGNGNAIIPPASQHHSGLAVVKRTVDDLTEAQKKSCDDFIFRLGEYNGTGERPNDATRNGLWKLVFDGWDTDCPNNHPGSIRKRRAVESMLEVGIWTVDLPAKAGSKRTQSGTTTNPCRKAGEKAFFKPSINWDAFGIAFNACDAKGANASSEFITLKPGWTLQQARAEAMAHWDRHESNRVQTYNTELVVCWARSRLLTLLRAAHMGGNAAGVRPVGTQNEIQENRNELVKLVTCQQKLRELEALATETRAIAQARPSRMIMLAPQ